MILKLNLRRELVLEGTSFQVEGIATAKTLKEGKNLAFPSTGIKSTMGKKESCIR